MSTTFLWGILTKLEVRQTKAGDEYATLAITQSFKGRDETLKSITSYVSVFDDYNMMSIEEGFIQEGNHLVLECSVSANAYTTREGKQAASLNFVANRIHNLDYAAMFNLKQQVQQAQQVQQTQFVAPNQNQFPQQQAPNQNQFPQQGQTQFVAPNQGQFVAPNQGVQQGQGVEQPAGNNPKWELDL